MDALTIIPSKITAMLIDRITANTSLASSYDRISRSVEPPLENVFSLLFNVSFLSNGRECVAIVVRICSIRFL